MIYFYSFRIHANCLEESVIERVVEVLFSQLNTLLTCLCGNKLTSCDTESSTPTWTPESSSSSASEKRIPKQVN